jgi:hypothetical protein
MQFSFRFCIGHFVAFNARSALYFSFDHIEEDKRFAESEPSKRNEF